MSMSSHAAGSSEGPVASTSRPYFDNANRNPSYTSLEVNVEPSESAASTSDCCKRPAAEPTSSIPIAINDRDADRMGKRQRQAPPTPDPLNQYSVSPGANMMTRTIPRPSPSAIRDMSPPIDRRVPPINSAECCLGIVACDERGEIVGWNS